MSGDKKPIYDEQSKIYNLKMGRIEAVIGDEKQPDEFYPRLKLKIWDNECNVSIGLITDKAVRDGAIIEQKDNMVSWRKDNIEARFYPLDVTEQYEDGGYEFEVVLYEPPESNVLEFSLNVPKELKFYYQPELTQKEKDEGAHQPENVIGSYAVYHASKGNMHKGQEEAEKYKTGKAFHIYRPKIIDANKDWTWGELSIDEKIGLLSVIIPQDWLNKAKYPITVDPTFGYTETGATMITFQDWVAWGVIAGSIFTGSSGNGVSISTWIIANYSDDPFRFALYDGNALVEKTEANDWHFNPDNWWKTLNFESTPVLSNKDYAIVAWSYYDYTLCYDSGDEDQGVEDDEYSSLPSTADFSHNNRKYSIYCTYEESGDETYWGESHIQSTSQLSTTAKKQTKAQSELTAISKLTATGRKVAQGEADITATNQLSATGQKYEAIPAPKNFQAQQVNGTIRLSWEVV